MHDVGKWFWAFIGKGGFLAMRFNLEIKKFKLKS